MSNLIERLRRQITVDGLPMPGTDVLHHEAADEIERLNKEIERKATRSTRQGGDMTDLIERLRKMPCGSPECDGGAIPHGPTPDGHWEAEQCQICAYIKEAADEIERLEGALQAANEQLNILTKDCKPALSPTQEEDDD